MINFYHRNFDFVKSRNTVLVISFFFIFVSCIIITIQGFNLGLDFTGGMLIEITADKDIDIINIQNIFIKSGFTKVVIQRLGVHQDFIIRVPLIKNYNSMCLTKIRIDILDILNTNIIGKFVVTQINWIGPIVSSDLIKKGIVALLIAMICILMYITFRFEWRVATGTVISLAHDIIIIVGIISFFAIEMNSTIVAALMSAIGYSLNDKIVIFDRIRENFCQMPTSSSTYIFNISLNQVLHRTIITSITTVAVLFILLMFGGSVLYEFSITLLIGVFIGTISSIYVASMLSFRLGTSHVHFMKK